MTPERGEKPLNKRNESAQASHGGRKAMGDIEGWGVTLNEFVWIMPPPLALVPLFSVEPPEEVDSIDYVGESDESGEEE